MVGCAVSLQSSPFIISRIFHALAGQVFVNVFSAHDGRVSMALCMLYGTHHYPHACWSGFMIMLSAHSSSVSMDLYVVKGSHHVMVLWCWYASQKLSVSVAPAQSKYDW